MNTRTSCPKRIRDHLMVAQSYRCWYCRTPFGSLVRYSGRLRMTQVHYDHLIPYAYLGRNPDWNWVAACQVCNLIKSSFVYRFKDDLRRYVARVRKERGFRVEWYPGVSNEEDPRKWAVKFASLLARQERGYDETIDRGLLEAPVTRREFLGDGGWEAAQIDGEPRNPGEHTAAGSEGAEAVETISGATR